MRCSSKRTGLEQTHFDDVGMGKLAEILYFANGRHVQTIFELAHFDLFDGDRYFCLSLTT